MVIGQKVRICYVYPDGASDIVQHTLSATIHSVEGARIELQALTSEGPFTMAMPKVWLSAAGPEAWTVDLKMDVLS